MKNECPRKRLISRDKERNHCVVVIKTATLLPREPTLDFRRRYWLDKRRQIQRFSLDLNSEGTNP
ncbi:hypothetical protein P5673_017843 [Acropora cervicornis]|uniref:Uncharacterized protein n=1 Tax=Acropora cervicornis TaxID=6130 RepID=A0AAD9QEB2_ACRCE|nr:hypothetical protein P5673_017843 [Acropora cervicornis]